MIEITFQAFALFLLCVVASSVSGMLLSSALPWSEHARTVGLARATGVALGPFIVGFGAVLALGVWRGASYASHAVATCGFVIVVGVIGYIKRRTQSRMYRKTHALSWVEWLLWVLIVGTIFALLWMTFFVPLTQNDGLEYAIVAREIYATRDLFSYPVLNATTNVSGFYGPWTHPPLYVALLYVANLIQGDAASPGLIRLISPWFMLCGAGLIYALGAYVNRLLGLLACLFFLSPPLFFLGVGSSLIDPLPVLGIALVMVVGLGVQAKPAVYGAVVGSMLGIALWTHSQAVIFIFLALAMVVAWWGLRHIKAWLCAVCVLMLMAIFIGVWPYWHNIQMFGTAVSDNPAVFALPSLYWNEYFSIGRGLGNTTALLQYGLFKGWFSPEAYGFIFFGMTLGVACFLCRQRIVTFRSLILEGMSEVNARDALLWLTTGLLVIYMLGMLASIVLGIEHMVKNERYLLVMLPATALLCAYGCKDIADVLSRRAARLSGLFFVVLAIAYVAHVGVLLKFAVSKIPQAAQLTQRMGEKNQHVPEIQLVTFLADAAAADDIVLSLRPADMYYASRRMVSYLDERLLPFYGKTDIGDAYDALQALGISYIHIPNYGIPPIYNSQLFALLRDPNYTSLLYQNAAGQVYALRPTALKNSAQQDISPSAMPWVLQDTFSLGGRKMFIKWGERNTWLTGSRYQKKMPYDLFHRHGRAVASVGIALPDMLPTEDAVLCVEPANEYAVDLTLEGAGLLEISVDQFSRKEGAEAYERVKHTEIVSFELSENQPRRDYGFRFLTEPTAQAMALNITSMGSSEVNIVKAVRSKMVRADAPAARPYP